MSFCSMFNRGTYAIEGWVCHYTLYQNNPHSNFYLLCMDKEVWEKANVLKNKGIVPIHIREIEHRYPQLPNIRDTRTFKEYIVTFKPFLPEFIFEKYNESVVVFADSDIAFFNDPEEIIRNLGDHSFLVKSHELDPPKAAGIYNVGLMAFKNNNDCLEWLHWWQEKCIEWCRWYADPVHGFAEQGRLDIFSKNPNRFQGIYITTHEGINLAPWNILKHPLKKVGKTIYAGNDKLICYHYHEFELRSGGYFPTGWKLPQNAKELLYDPYFKLINRSINNTLWR